MTLSRAPRLGPRRRRPRPRRRRPALEGTKPWAMPADPAKAMVEGLHAYLDRETRAAAARRDGRWDRVHTSAGAYTKSVDP